MNLRYGLLTSILWISFGTIEAQSMTEPSATVSTLGGGVELSHPTSLSDAGSAWPISLNVDICEKTFGWLTLMRRCYNMVDLVGPTWKIKPGDTITVTLNNNLADIQNTNIALNRPRFPNTTNLHTHGLHISSQDPQDNVLKHIDPESSHTYIYQIHPDNPPGTYWYHSHLHGATMFQVHGGLAGMIIVQDSADVLAGIPELDAVSCPNNCEFEKELVFQPLLQYTGGQGFGNLQDRIEDNESFQHDSYIITATGPYNGESLSTWMAAELNYFTVNAQLQPIMSLTTGQMYRFRMVNAGGNNVLEVHIVDSSNNPACTIREIATDGIYLDAPREMPEGQTLLVPGGRVDWMVKCDTAGTYTLRSFPDTANDNSIPGIGRYTGTLATLSVMGSASTMAFPTTLPPKPEFMRDLSGVAQANIGGRFVVELDPRTHLNREVWSSGTYYRYKMIKNTVQEWHLTNTDPGDSHPLHIHVNHFQIISYNEYTGPYANGVQGGWALYQLDTSSTLCAYQHAGYTAGSRGPPANNPLRYLGHDTRYAADNGGTLGYARVGDRRDVVLVPPLANITIRFEAHEHTGDVIIHCHILNHEDAGMMLITEVVDTGEDTTANTQSGGYYPGTCQACDRYPFNNEATLCESSGSSDGHVNSRSAEILMIFVCISWILWPYAGN